jgi:hypothetical protein
VFAILYGVPVWGFAVLWIALATSLTVRTLRRGMPFALTWWSLTFPVGSFVTGTSQLAAHPSTGLQSGRGDRLHRYVVHLATGGRPHRPSQPARQPAQGGAEQRAGQGQQGSSGLVRKPKIGSVIRAERPSLRFGG